MLLTLYGSFKKGIWQRNHNRHFLNLLQCSYTQPRFQAVMLVPIEASYFNNLQINKQSLLRDCRWDGPAFQAEVAGVRLKLH